MKRFIKKTIARPRGLGDELQGLREAEHMTTGALAVRTGIAEKYIVALEAEEVRVLPSMMYARQFLVAIAKTLHAEPGRLLALLHQSWRMGFEDGSDASMGAFVPRPGSGAFAVTPRIIRLGAGAIFALVLATMLVGKAYTRIRPPELMIEFPRDNLTVAAPTITLSGRTEPEGTVQINGVVVLPDETGYFKSFVDLKQGVNILRVSSKKPRTSERVEYRRVVYEP